MGERNLKTVEKLHITETVAKTFWTEEVTEIDEAYDEIRLHYLWAARIGEFLPRVFIAAEDTKKNMEQRILDVFVISDCIRVNHAIVRVLKRSMNIVDLENLSFWCFIIEKLHAKTTLKYWNEYEERCENRSVSYGSTIELMKLTEEEQIIGLYRKNQMGIKGDFIAISNRDSLYLTKDYEKKDWTYHNYRNSSIENFQLTAEQCLKKNIQLVRMGKNVEVPVKFSNCVDYASLYYNDLMDLVLMRDCKFYLGSPHGINSLPMAYGKRMAQINMTYIDRAFGCYPELSEDHLMILKKYYSKKLNRYLTLREKFQIDKYALYRGERYQELGIDLLENTPEEIWDVAEEMNDRLDGIWQEPSDNELLQKQFKKILDNWLEEENLDENGACHCNIGYKFLKSNLYLLDKGCDRDIISILLS